MAGAKDVTVIRIRCNGCEKNVTLCTKKKKKFEPGEKMGIKCSDLKAVYDSLGGCDEELVFFRTQGQREQRRNDPMLEDLGDRIEKAKSGEPENEEPNPLDEE